MLKVQNPFTFKKTFRKYLPKFSNYIPIVYMQSAVCNFYKRKHLSRIYAADRLSHIRPLSLKNFAEIQKEAHAGAKMAKNPSIRAPLIQDREDKTK